MITLTYFASSLAFANSYEDMSLSALTAEAETGNVNALSVLGSRLYYSRQFTEAIKWNMRAAIQGDGQAQYLVGEAYFHGDGVEKNTNEGLSWYLEAANNGILDSQEQLILIYEHGLGGINKSNEEAEKWRLAQENNKEWQARQDRKKKASNSNQNSETTEHRQVERHGCEEIRYNEQFGRLSVFNTCESENGYIVYIVCLPSFSPGYLARSIMGHQEYNVKGYRKGMLCKVHSPVRLGEMIAEFNFASDKSWGVAQITTEIGYEIDVIENIPIQSE